MKTINKLHPSLNREPYGNYNFTDNFGDNYNDYCNDNFADNYAN